MKRFIFSLIAFISLGALGAKAQTIVYDLDFDYIFDNREFDRGGNAYSTSMSINSAVVTPWVGLKIDGPEDSQHRLMLGAELSKDFGSGLAPASRILFYEKSEVKFSSGAKFTGACGLYPRKLQKGDYSQFFVSDSLKFYDRTMEGMLLQYSTQRTFAELGLDWMGQYGDGIRECFEVYSAGQVKLLPVLSLGWNAVMHHLACSYQIGGVAETITLLPYLKLDFSGRLGLDIHTLRVGALASFQRDRTVSMEPDMRYGLEAIYKIGKRKIEAENQFYAGHDLMPLLHELYRGDPFYRSSVFDKLTLRYHPVSLGWMDVLVDAQFCFTPEGYQGCRQLARLIFNLDALYRK